MAMLTPTRVAQADGAAAISLDTDLNKQCVGLWVGAAGNVSVDLWGEGSAVVLIGVTAGTFIPLRVRQVNTTGTTVASPTTNIVYFYLV